MSAVLMRTSHLPLLWLLSLIKSLVHRGVKQNSLPWAGITESAHL